MMVGLEQLHIMGVENFGELYIASFENFPCIYSKLYESSREVAQ